MSQPFYHLRPNKYVDRYLFISALEKINSQMALQKHRYIGFGSYQFDDFKLLHNRLNIENMISLEADSSIFERAQYNAPYKCIEVLNQTSTDFISGDRWGDENSIIWLDYVSPRQLASQFSDIATLTNILLPHDILKVTFNANADTLGEVKKGNEDTSYMNRLELLKSRIGEYLPYDTQPEDCVKNKYPQLLLKSLHNLITRLFTPNMYDKRYFLPLFSTVYQDGNHLMLTFMGMVLDNEEDEKHLRDAFADTAYVNFKWDEPSEIRIPDLTIKEMLEINKLLPSERAEEQLKDRFSFVFGENERGIKSYISFYKYYPNFHNVSF